MKFVLAFWIVFIISNNLSSIIVAQNDAQYTRYMFNPSIINPAYIGRLSKKKLDATFIHRNQWTGLEGSPKTYLVSIYGSINKKINWGTFLENDLIGIHNRLNWYGRYAYKVSYKKANLTLGVGGGLFRQSSDWTKLDNIYDPDDPILVNESILKPDFEIGSFFDWDDKIFIGVSSRHISALMDKSFPIETHYYFIGETKIKPEGSGVELRPSILFKATFGNIPDYVTDFNLNAVLNNTFGVGIGYQSTKRIALLFQYWTLFGVKVGYGFDYNLNMFRSNYGSHEVMVNYNISRTTGRAKPEKKPNKKTKKR